MKKNEIIKSKNIFTKIIKTGNYNKNKSFVIYYKENETSKTRFGIAVSNKLGNAVIRNKLKRQTKEIIDKKRFLFQNNQDYIIMIRKGSLEESFKNRLDSFNELFKGDI